MQGNITIANVTNSTAGGNDTVYVRTNETVDSASDNSSSEAAEPAAEEAAAAEEQTGGEEL